MAKFSLIFHLELETFGSLWTVKFVHSYRVTHKGWDFRADCTELIHVCALYLWFSETKNWFLLLANYNKQCEKKIFKADELISCLSLLIDSSGEWGLWILGGGNGVDAIDNVQENYFYFIRNTRRSMNISASIFLHV